MSKALEGEVVVRRKLTPKQELFCQAFATDREFFGNGTASYIAAYNPSRLRPGWYAAARSSAHRLLTNANILARINELLEEGNLNDQHVDKQLRLLITQNADFNAKLGGIREYNKLRGRIEEKIKHSGEVTVKQVEVMDVGGGDASQGS